MASSNGHSPVLTIAWRIRDARIRAGLSQQDVANLMGKSRPSITMMESGQRKVTSHELASMAEIYKVSPTYLLGQEKPSMPDFIQLGDIIINTKQIVSVNLHGTTDSIGLPGIRDSWVEGATDAVIIVLTTLDPNGSPGGFNRDVYALAGNDATAFRNYIASLGIPVAVPVVQESQEVQE